MTTECVSLDEILGQDKFTLTSQDMDTARRIANESGLSLDSVASSLLNMRPSSSSSTWTTTSHAVLRPRSTSGGDNTGPSRLSYDSSAHTAWTLTADATLLQPPTCVSVHPGLEFTLDGNIPNSKHTLILHNASPNRHVVFKLKVPNKHRTVYTITPNLGILRPQEALSIVVEVADCSHLVKDVPVHTTKTYVHQFMLQLLHAPDATCDQLEYLDYGEQHRVQAALWAQAEPTAIQQCMLTCSLPCTRLACLTTARRIPSSLSTLNRRSAQGATLTLTNLNTTSVAFKIKTNCGATSTPSFGVLASLSTISIHLAPKNYATKPTDRLRIESVALPDYEEHIRRDGKRTADDLRRIVQAAWPSIDDTFKACHTIHPWESSRKPFTPKP
ncbi:unnamed protein product [Aphanomyces euteiches]|uniref:MSP domain-containing protein n=1 Tax=Aphanomyces euteiches TaxID=100861 RepID=A0A6G0X3F7_9STRA|nr:hypothetical protein Ae201684_008905 [Aphanomyces euteiches]KAH9054378.1 hypothetical protein Ae201684P_018099 [Aphanomyces euteiches]KAH9135194.1 hypothetical protein AeRB84_019300 [Aphanomyces euteiches]